MPVDRAIHPPLCHSREGGNPGKQNKGLQPLVLKYERKTMKTSYFAKKTAATDPNAVSIARWPPRWWTTGRRYIALAPSADLLKRSKAGLPWPEFVKEYQRDVLDKLDPAKVLSDLGADAILLCWEKPGDDCHRHLVAEWLEKTLNIKVNELK